MTNPYKLGLLTFSLNALSKKRSRLDAKNSSILFSSIGSLKANDTSKKNINGLYRYQF